MKRYYKSLLSFFMCAVILISVFLPAIGVSAEENIVYSEISLVSDGEVSESGYLNEIWVDEDGEEVKLASISDGKPVPNKLSEIPEKYSSVDYGYVSDVRNQGGTNSCWAFSAVAAAESSLLKQNLVKKSDSISDLSEAHLVWFTHKSLTTDVNDPTFGDGTNEGSPYTKGGYWLRSTYTLARGSGLALEKDYPYYPYNTSMMGNYDESERYERYVSLDEAYLLPDDDTDAIKQAVIDNGSVMVAAGVYMSYFNQGADGYAYYQNIALDTNHQMIVVGWDDNFSIDNFGAEAKPSRPGAWLVKNSYDVSFGDDGYFWISYEDPSLTDFVVQKVSLANEDENVYQYDGYGYMSGVGGKTSTGSPVQYGAQANVFVAEKDEMIDSVAFYTMQDSVEYEITVYKNVSYGKSSPIENGTKSSVVTSGYAQYKGYHKIPLAANIPLDKGETFTVVVAMYYTGDTTTPLYIPCEGKDESSDGYYVRYYTSERYQSYYCLGAGNWIESTTDDDSKRKNNLCIKAFTVSDNSLEIRTAEEFNAFATEVANGKSYDGKNINLMNDIDFDGGEIIPVGTERNPFGGYFRGNGYVLKNGVIDSSSDIVGVFSAISADSEIKKLGVENVSVNGVYGVGAICGINEGTIQHCYSTGSVSGEESVGGLVGINCGKVSNSYSTCSVSGDYYVGSFIGESNSGEDVSCYVSSSSPYEPIGNDYGNVTSIPDKCFSNGLAAFYLDEGKSTARAEVWTKRDGITTFLKFSDEIIYQIELYDKTDFSSVYLYVKSSENLTELAEAERPGKKATIYADPQYKVLYTASPKSNMMLYVQWENLHSCKETLSYVQGIDADCYTDGNIPYYKCSCGKLYINENAETAVSESDVLIPAFNHPSESLIKTDRVEPTHTEDGNVEYYTCTLCKDSFLEESCVTPAESVTILATGHSYGDWITETEASCENDGLEVKLCSCGDKIKKVIPATGHSYGDWITETEASCEKDGLEVKLCSCGSRIEKVISATGHSYGDWITETEASCEKDGLEVKLCSCGNRIEKTIPATGHSFGSWVTETEPDCENDGMRVRVCSSCGERSEIKLSALGHDYNGVIFEPTESEIGYTIYTCTICGDAYVSDYIYPTVQMDFGGVVTSYLSDTDKVLIELIRRGEEEVSYSMEVSGKKAVFIFENISSGAYTIRISKDAHAVYEDMIIIEKNMDVSRFVIHPIGDVNGDGKVNSIDVAMINAHSKGVTPLKDYQFTSADVTGDGRVNSVDVARVNAHAKGVSLLF